MRFNLILGRSYDNNLSAKRKIPALEQPHLKFHPSKSFNTGSHQERGAIPAKNRRDGLIFFAVLAFNLCELCANPLFLIPTQSPDIDFLS